MVLEKLKFESQNDFEQLYQIALNGMNIGSGASSESGELQAIKYISSKLLENLTIFDVGANIGNYTLLLKKEFKDKAIIYSFEPSRITFDRLLLNVKDCNNIVSYNFGFGNKNEEVILYTNSDASELASVYKRKLDHFKIFMDKTETICIKTIDSFCNDNNIKHIDFLKLDVEGNEINVLNGAKQMLNEINFIQFEFGGCNIDSRTFFQDFYYFLNDKYQIYRIIKDGLYPINQYKEMYEAFVTTNYLAEKRK